MVTAAVTSGTACSAVHLTDIRETLNTALGGRYTLEPELGRGGMATIYLAQDLNHDRPVAVKVLHPEQPKYHSYASNLPALRHRSKGKPS
jgi:hypothetical protein